MANPSEFLSDWTRDHVDSTVYDDEPTAKLLANECLQAAKKAGINEGEVVKAAGGDLAGYFLAELNKAMDTEAARQKNKS